MSEPTHTRVFLTGFMGVGKSTIGAALADCLGTGFVDLDNVIVSDAGRSIPEIFEAEGEPRFRALESRALKQVIAEKRAGVIALGGGAFQRPENRDLIREHGVSVWIRRDLATLCSRLSKSETSRPLLQGSNGSQLRGAALRRRVSRLLRERAPDYESADIHFQAGDYGAVERQGEALAAEIAAFSGRSNIPT